MFDRQDAFVMYSFNLSCSECGDRVELHRSCLHQTLENALLEMKCVRVYMYMYVQVISTKIFFQLHFLYPVDGEIIDFTPNS